MTRAATSAIAPAAAAARAMPVHAAAGGDGPALVAIHGFTGTGAVWAPLRAALGPRRRVAVVDLPGHGRSAPPPPGTGLADIAAAVVAAVETLGIARADWLGYSLGGRVALHVAVHHPERVGRLVLESASAGLRDPALRAARAAADDALAAALERDGLPAFVDRWLAQPLFAAQARLPAPVRAAEHARRLVHSPAGLAAALRATTVGRQECLLERLHGVGCPVLLIAGADDAAYHAHAAAMAAVLPDARTVIVPHAGHTPHLENPAAFHAAVAAFLDGAAAA